MKTPFRSRSSSATWADDAHLADLLDRTAGGDHHAFMEFYDATCHLVWRLELSRQRTHRRASEAMCARYTSAAQRAAEHPDTGLSARAWLLSLRLPSSREPRPTLMVAS